MVVSRIAEEAALKMVQLMGAENYLVQNIPGKSITITEAFRSTDDKDDDERDNNSSNIVNSSSNSNGGSNLSSSDESGLSNVQSGRQYKYTERVLHLQCGNMFDVPVATLELADVIMMETDIPADVYPQLQRLLQNLKENARLLSYLDLRRIWDNAISPLPFRQLEINRNLSDRYPTSWSVQRGHHFYLWMKVTLKSLNIELMSIKV